MKIPIYLILVSLINMPGYYNVIIHLREIVVERSSSFIHTSFTLHNGQSLSHGIWVLCLLRLLLESRFLFFLCVSFIFRFYVYAVLPAHMSVHNMNAVPTETKQDVESTITRVIDSC